MNEPIVACFIFLILFWTAWIHSKLSTKIRHERDRGDQFFREWVKAKRHIQELERPVRDLALPPGRSKYEQPV